MSLPSFVGFWEVIFRYFCGYTNPSGIMQISDGLKPCELGWEISGCMIIQNEFWLSFQLICVANCLQWWYIACSENFQWRLFSKVSVDVFVFDVGAGDQQDAPEAIPQTPPSFEDSSARYCDFVTAVIKELYAFVFKLG